MARDTQNEFETFAKQKPRLTVLTDHALKADLAKTTADTFNLRLEVGPVYDIIRYKRTRTPMAILISGGWGMGKTSAMRWLEGLLDIWNDNAGKNDIKVRPVWFYPWKYDNKEDVRRGLIAEVIINSIDIKTASTQTVISAAKQFGMFLGKSFLHVLASIKLKGKLSAGAEPAKAEGEAEVDLASIKEILSEYQQTAHPEKAYLNEFETTLQRWVKSTLGKNERMVIFIDDLDRCMPEISLQVLEALKLYLNIEKLIFVVGVDKKIVEKLVIEHYKKLGLVKETSKAEKKEQADPQLKQDEKKATQYLSKMFQVEVHLDPTEKQIGDFFAEQLNELTYWKRPYLSEDEQKLFRDLVLQFAGRNPREVKRLLNSALMTGAGAVMMQTARIEFKQGLQLFFVRKILDERYTMGSAAGSNRGTEFFAQWSRIVRVGRKKDKEFPCTIRVPAGFPKPITESAKDKGAGMTPEAKASAAAAKTRKPDLSFIREPYREAYRALLENSMFSGLFHLLADEDLGRLMQIQYPAEAAEVVGPSKDADIVREAVARFLNTPSDALTDEDYRKVDTLDLSQTSLSDTTALRPLSNLQVLALNLTQVEDIRALGELKNLIRLGLYQTRVTDIAPLASLKKLEQLNLGETQVKNIEVIAQLQELRWLSLNNSRAVGDVGALASLAKLEHLVLDGTQVKDIGPLASLTNLKLLSLSDTPVADIGSLARLRLLERLYLERTPVTDIGVLKQLPNLQMVFLEGTNVTDEQVAELQQARAELAIGNPRHDSSASTGS